MKTLKKCLATLLSVIMILSLSPVTIRAASSQDPGNAIREAPDGAEDASDSISLSDLYNTDDAGDVTENASDRTSTDELSIPIDSLTPETSDPAENQNPAEDASRTAGVPKANDQAPADTPADEQGFTGPAEECRETGESFPDDSDEILIGASSLTYRISFQYGQTEARSMLSMVNGFRQSSDAWYWNPNNTTKTICSGLSALTYDYQLEAVAMKRAAEIAALYSHTRPDGSSCFTAYDETGYTASRKGENIAAGYRTASAVYTAWREDDDFYEGQGHRRNMLNSSFNRIGIGHVIANGRHFWVQEFAYSTGTIVNTAANDASATADLSIDDQLITSAAASASPDSMTASYNKSVDLPEVTMTLNICDPVIKWTNTVNAIVSCTWTSADSSIAAIKGGKLTGVSLGNTVISTTVRGIEISVPVTAVFDPVTVGDNVTAQLILEGNEYVLYFNSQNGTLWNNWKSIVGPIVNSTNKIAFASGSGKMYLPANSSAAFSGLSKLTDIDTGKIDTSKVTNANAMFSGCSAITSLNMSGFDLSSVSSQTNANDMFKNCSSLSEIDTPKKVNASVNMMLPAVFVNDNADQLVRLPVNTSGSVKIKKYNPGTPQIVNMSKCTASLSASQYTYNGSAKKPSVTVTHAWTKETAGSGASVTSTAMTDTLTADKDYTLAYSNNVNAGTATVTVTGKGNYTGSIKKTYTISKANPVLKFANSSVSKTSIDDPFTNALTKTTDGAVTFASSNTAVAAVDKTSGKVTLSYTGFGTATITANAAVSKNYKAGSASYTLTVVDGRIDIARCTVVLNTTIYTYDGSAKEPAATITYKNTALTEGSDFTLAYSNNVNAGEGRATVTGNGKYKGSRTLQFRIDPADPILEFAKSSVSKTDLDKPFKNTLTKETDGTVTFKSDNKAVATVNSKNGTVTIKGIGTATITATAAAGKNYKTGSISFTLKVKKKDIIPVYRLFNTRTGEHFYTASLTERSQYLNAGNWNSEGIAWYAPRKSSEPIYRLSNPNNGNEHHYTKSKSERDWLVGLGWKYNGIAWYSDTDKLVPIYRHYHPIQRTGNHHYTTSKGESNHIVKYEGWKYEGISFYVSKAGG